MQLNRTSTRIGVALLVLGFLWMDVCLYYHIQAMRGPLDLAKIDQHQHRPAFSFKRYFGHPSALDASRSPRGVSPRPANATFESVSSIGGHQRSAGRLAAWIAPFSFAFRGLSVKLMMTDPMDNYLLGPLADAVADSINFRDNLKFISANMVSAAGVASGLISAKLVVSGRPWLAFGFFQLRNWFDCLDGLVARSRLGITRHVSLDQTWGFWVDGVCDVAAFLAFTWAIYLLLKRSHHETHPTLRNKPHRNGTEPNHERLILLIGVFLLQLALCSAGWNKYMLEYRRLLESTSSSVHAAQFKLETLKTNIMFALVWLWRLTNGHSFMQALAVSMLMDSVCQFLRWIKLAGLIAIVLLVLVTHLHTIDIANYLSMSNDRK